MLRNYQEKSAQMLKIGQINQLTVIDEFPFGFYLDSGRDEKVLLTHKNAPQGCKVGSKLDVFVYHDNDDRLIASCSRPYVCVNEVASLTVKAISSVGAFMDWGLEKDLLVPFNEQNKPMQEGLRYVVYVFQDEQTERLAGSTKLHHFLSDTCLDYKPKQPVELIICGRTDLGYKAVINGSHLGLIFKDEVIRPLHIGQKANGYVKRVRDDGKIDLCFQFHDDDARMSLTDQILEDLIAHGGFSTLTDKSSAEDIFKRFKVSKNAYKKAIGALYKQKKITLDKNKISLVE